MKNILFHMSVIFLLFVMVVMNTEKLPLQEVCINTRFFSKKCCFKAH